MSATSSSLNRRDFLAGSAAVGAASLFPAAARAATQDSAIRPFRVNIPEEQLADLRRRIAATRWPDRETVNDGSQGVQLAKLQELGALLGNGLRLAKGRGASSTPCRNS